MTTPLRLSTCSFGEFNADMGVPVRTSNGHPRWKLPYKLEHSANDLFPPRMLLRPELPAQEFSNAYLAHLDHIGTDAIAAHLTSIATAENTGTLVLLCFEKLATRKTCHRTDFATWWTDRTGHEVRELGSPTPDPLPL